MGTESEPERAPAQETVDLVAILDECFVLESCVDHYLWELYQRTAKQDTNRVTEWRKVKVKKKRKMVIVKQRFMTLVDADFTWKDPHAAEKVGMSLMDYVIGGMDRDFKLRLFQTLRAAEKAGLSPGITSGFRDDYRQSIASGQKAASNRSYHGGSLRGGYGHGVAADVVSTKGANRAQRWLSTVSLWTWIDANERQTGIGRPYLGRDPPHVAPIDGEEYVSRRGSKTDVAKAEEPEPEEKKPVQVAGQVEKQGAKPSAKLKQARARRSSGFREDETGCRQTEAGDCRQVEAGRASPKRRSKREAGGCAGSCEACILQTELDRAIPGCHFVLQIVRFMVRKGSSPDL